MNDFHSQLSSGKKTSLGSGCGSVGRAVAFDTRGPWFDSSHWQNFIEQLFIINCIEKTKINKKSTGMAHFKKRRQNPNQAIDRKSIMADKLSHN